VDFEWDPKKAAGNISRHGVSFDEAKELFLTGAPFLEIYDEEGSYDEDRFIAVGEIRRGIVVVVWIERYENTHRIISARWATKNETTMYVEFMRAMT